MYYKENECIYNYNIQIVTDNIPGQNRKHSSSPYTFITVSCNVYFPAIKRCIERHHNEYAGELQVATHEDVFYGTYFITYGGVLVSCIASHQSLYALQLQIFETS